MSNFRAYLKETNQTLTSFAERVGISKNYLSEVASFKKKPSYDLAIDITLATGGIIPFTYWRDARPADEAGGEDVSHTAIKKSTEETEPHV